MKNNNEFLRRSRFEVIYEILSFCRMERQKTRIMYKCNLSFRLLKKYIDFLLDRRLLENSEENRYHTTLQGMRFLEGYKIIKETLKKDGDENSRPRYF